MIQILWFGHQKPCYVLLPHSGIILWVSLFWSTHSTGEWVCLQIGYPENKSNKLSISMMLLDDGIEHDANLHGARPEVGIVIPSLCPLFLIYFSIKSHINPDVVLDHTRDHTRFLHFWAPKWIQMGSFWGEGYYYMWPIRMIWGVGRFCCANGTDPPCGMLDNSKHVRPSCFPMLFSHKAVGQMHLAAAEAQKAQWGNDM